MACDIGGWNVDDNRGKARDPLRFFNQAATLMIIESEAGASALSLMPPPRCRPARHDHGTEMGSR